MDLQPLRFPTPWPVPDRPRDRFDSIPVLGHFLRFVTELVIGSPYGKLESDISDQITRQLEQRDNSHETWPLQAEQQRVVQALRAAVCQEKGLDSLTIHPLDPAILLFWSSYDDLTPLIFSLALESEFQMPIHRDDLFEAIWGKDFAHNGENVLQPPVTVEQLVDRCLTFLKKANCQGG